MTKATAVGECSGAKDFSSVGFDEGDEGSLADDLEEEAPDAAKDAWEYVIARRLSSLNGSDVLCATRIETDVEHVLNITNAAGRLERTVEVDALNTPNGAAGR